MSKRVLVNWAQPFTAIVLEGPDSKGIMKVESPIRGIQYVYEKDTSPVSEK